MPAYESPYRKVNVEALDRDVDESEERRTFTIRAVELRCKPTVPAASFSRYAAYTQELIAGEGWPSESFEILNTVLRNSLEADSRDRWDDVIAGNEESPRPIELGEMLRVIEHIAEVTAKRPTQPSSLSGNTGGNGSTKLTDVSVSPVEPEPTALISEHS